jgi:hypothetical protein
VDPGWIRGVRFSMPITIYSPHSGRPVKVRDQDAGRAVKDEEGRIFYVLPKSDGSGYYGALTTSGNPKEEARAKEFESKVGQATEHVHAQVEAMQPADTARSGLRGKVLVLSAVAVVLFLVWLFTLGPLNAQRLWTHTAPPPPREILVGGGRDTGSAGASGNSAEVVQAVPTPDPHDPKMMVLPNGLKYEVVKRGSGAAVKIGDRVQVRYTGYLSSGVKFDASSPDMPFELTIGAPQTLRFWNDALPGMVEGEKRTLIVPPELHYGHNGNSIVPPDETVRYEVELLHIITGTEP